MKRIYVKFYIAIAACFFCTVAATAQDYSAALAAADTSKFSVNRDAGWDLFNSWVGINGEDSASVELILQHANNILWTDEQLAGQITYEAAKPQQEQNVWFVFGGTSYLLRILPDGKCYLKLMYGNAPVADPYIVSLNVGYRRTQF